MRKMRKKLGFTLVEVLVALTILAIAMLGFVPMVITTIRAHSFGNKMTRAAELAQDKLEDIRRMEFTDPDISPMAYPWSSTPETFDNIYERVYSVDLIAANTSIKRITVSVDWRATGVSTVQNTTYVTTKVRY